MKCLTIFHPQMLCQLGTGDGNRTKQMLPDAGFSTAQRATQMYMIHRHTAQTAAQEWMVNKMAEYINRQAAIDAVGDVHPLDYNSQAIVERLKNLPSADVAPVVRCKHCHFFEPDHWETVSGVPLIVAHNICTRWGKGCQTAEDGFCFMAIRSQGARMDGDANAE